MSSTGLYQRMVGHLANHFPEVRFRVPTKEPILALTLDDAPEPLTTSKIANTLRQHGCSATFFVVGRYIEGNEKILHRLIQEGHELGNHMWDTTPSWRLTPTTFQLHFERTQQALRDYGGTQLFRPASGWFRRHMLQHVRSRGCETVLGSVYPLDAELSSVGFSTSFILQNVTPGGIIILHDRGSRGHRTARVLEHIIPALQERGYVLYTVSELLHRSLGDIGAETHPSKTRETMRAD